MNQGKIIEFIDQGKLTCTLCLEDNGNKLHLLTTNNREINLPPKRALLISSVSLDPKQPREILISRLREKDDQRAELKDEVKVKELWELVRDDEETYDFLYLAQLCFGEEVTDEHISALVRALFEDNLYFKMKDNRFTPNPESRVEQIFKQKEEEARRDEQLRLGSSWIKDLLNDRDVQPPPNQQEITGLLVDLVLYDRESATYKYARELLERSGITDVRKAREILVLSGAWDEDENIDLIRFGIASDFSPEAEDESGRLNAFYWEQDKREDLRDLEVFTIDGPLTRDFDDALSLRFVGDEIHLGIHITDVAGAIPPDSRLDREARSRASSLYLPHCQKPMLPDRLSHEILSLIKDSDRPALSLLVRLNPDGELISHQFVRSLVRVREQLTYDQVNQGYKEDQRLEWLCRFSRKFREKRIDQGALILSLPEAVISLGDDSKIEIDLVPQDTPSRMMVAELMILYNWLGALFCRDNQAPILYRSQEAPTERLNPDMNYVYFVFMQRRKLNRLVVDTEAKPHSGLGLSAYTNLSSPIRRYLDLIAQRQVDGFLKSGTPVYHQQTLDEIRMEIEPILRNLTLIQRNRLRYWILKYLGQHVGEIFPAMILDVMKSRYRILLTDILFVTEIKQEALKGLSSGESVQVKVRKADPWEDILVLEPVKEQNGRVVDPPGKSTLVAG